MKEKEREEFEFPTQIDKSTINHLFNKEKHKVTTLFDDVEPS